MHCGVVMHYPLAVLSLLQELVRCEMESTKSIADPEYWLDPINQLGLRGTDCYLDRAGHAWAYDGKVHRYIGKGIEKLAAYAVGSLVGCSTIFP